MTHGSWDREMSRDKLLHERIKQAAEDCSLVLGDLEQLCEKPCEAGAAQELCVRLLESFLADARGQTKRLREYAKP